VFSAVSWVEGMMGDMGGHISPAVTPRRCIWKLPPEVTPVETSGLVLTQVGYNCGIRAPINVGDKVLVIGDGLVGQWAAQTAAWRGARVLMAGHHPERMAMFDAPGGVTIDTRSDDIQKLRLGEKSVHAPSGWTTKRMDETLELIALKKLSTAPLISHQMPVEQAAEAWDLIRNHRDQVMGVVLTWAK